MKSSFPKCPSTYGLSNNFSIFKIKYRNVYRCFQSEGLISIKKSKQWDDWLTKVKFFFNAVFSELSLQGLTFCSFTAACSSLPPPPRTQVIALHQNIILWGASLVVQLVKILLQSRRSQVQFPGLRRSPGEAIGYPLQYSWASLVTQLVKNMPAMWETWVWFPGWEDPLEKGKATYSSILAWRISWTV